MSTPPGPSILLVRFGSLGDVVLTFGAAEALSRARPGARLVYLVKREYADLVRAQPWASEVWELGPEERGATEWGTWRERVRDARFDTVVDWQTSPRSRALLAGHPRRLEWRAERLARWRWVHARWTRPAPVRAAWIRYHDAITPLGAIQLAHPVLHVPSAAADAAERTFAAWDGTSGGSRPTTAIAPGARWATKRWPEERSLELARAEVERGGRVLVVGDAIDRAALPTLAHWCDEEPRARWASGSLLEIAAQLARCSLAFGNDTGISHLADALGLRHLVIFGSTHPGLGFAPASDRAFHLSTSLSCQPCTLHGRRTCPKGHHRCVRDLSESEVRHSLERLRAGAAQEGD